MPLGEQVQPRLIGVPLAEAAIQIAEWGDPHAAETVLCVHGLTRNGRDFDALAAALAAEGRRVLCPDMPGRGGSGSFEDPTRYRNDVYAELVLILLDELEVAGPVDWIGTSMGGLIGMIVAAGRPDKVRRFVVNDVGPFIPAAALQRIKDYIGIPHRFSTFEQAERHVRRAYAPFGDLTDAQWRHLTRISVWEQGAWWSPAYDLRIAEPFAAGVPGDVSIWPLWQAIRAPTLVLRGAKSDLLLPATARGMAAARPNVEVVEIPGCGHAPALMDPAQIAIVTGWLARTRA